MVSHGVCSASGILGCMSGSLGGVRRMLGLALVAGVCGGGVYGQVPCPVALVDAKAEKDSIQLEFMNKGKVPIEQLSLACSPAGNNKFSGGICHVENGIFYPSTVTWIKIDYLGANRHVVEISVKELHLARGIVWEPRPSNACKVFKVTRRN